MRTRSLAAAVAVVALLTACGGAAPPAESPTTREGAEAQLDRAEAQVFAMFGAPQQQYGYGAPAAQPGYPQAPGADASKPSPPPPPPAPLTAPPVAADAPRSPENGASTQATQDPCSVACRALASMTNAAERLCDLAGQGDLRCTGAQTRLRNAREIVQRQCPRCG